MHRTPLRRLTWIALLAIWASVCMPALAQFGARSTAPPADWCLPGAWQAEGGTTVNGATDADPDEAHWMTSPICSYCLLQVMTPVLPVAGRASPPACASILTTRLPAAQDESRACLDPWRLCTAPPRAPPRG